MAEAWDVEFAPGFKSYFYHFGTGALDKFPSTPCCNLGCTTGLTRPIPWGYGRTVHGRYLTWWEQGGQGTVFLTHAALFGELGHIQPHR